MQMFAMIVLVSLLGGGLWFFCRSVDSRSRNQGTNHGGGFDGAGNSIHHD